MFPIYGEKYKRMPKRREDLSKISRWHWRLHSILFSTCRLNAYTRWNASYSGWKESRINRRKHVDVIRFWQALASWQPKRLAKSEKRKGAGPRNHQWLLRLLPDHLLLLPQFCALAILKRKWPFWKVVLCPLQAIFVFAAWLTFLRCALICQYLHKSRNRHRFLDLI